MQIANTKFTEDTMELEDIDRLTLEKTIKHATADWKHQKTSKSQRGEREKEKSARSSGRPETEKTESASLRSAERILPSCSASLLELSVRPTASALNSLTD